jgi:hypothetical protein
MSAEHSQGGGGGSEQPASFASIKNKANLLVQDQVQQIIGVAETTYDPKMVRS